MTDDEWLATLTGRDAGLKNESWNEASALRNAVLTIDAEKPIDQLKKQRLIKEMRRLELLDDPQTEGGKGRGNQSAVTGLRSRLPKATALASIAAGLAAVVFMAPYFGRSPDLLTPVGTGSGDEVRFRGRPIQLVFEDEAYLRLGGEWQDALTSMGINSQLDKTEGKTLLKITLGKADLAPFLTWWNADSARQEVLPLTKNALPPSGQIWIELKRTP